MISFAGLPAAGRSTEHCVFVGEEGEGRADGGDAIGDPSSLCMFHLADFDVHNPPIPEPLPEVPAKACHAIKEAELEEIADAEVGNGAEVRREAVVLCFARIGPDAGLQALDCLLRFALCITAMLLFPPFKGI